MDKEIMDNIIKKVATINDISCLGGASLTQNIPIFSSMGIKSYPVPTVVLSTHSGGYQEYTYHDLTEHMKEQTEHWSKLDVKFDCIYSGFLGSAEQIVIVEDFIDKFKKEDTLIVIDPVMGDKGKIYSSIDQDIVLEMRKLVSRADVITPNLTEAFLLADIEYNPKPNEEVLNELIDKIEELGPKNIIITSYPYKDQIANIVVKEDQVDIVRTRKIDSDFPGTGDIFTSVLIGSYLNGLALVESTQIASAFVKNTIAFSKDKEYSHRSGVLLEAALPQLYKYNKFFN